MKKMTTMNISLPNAMKIFVDEQVSQRGYGTSSEYLRELIRKEQERDALRELLVAGASARPVQEVNAQYFDELRKKAKKLAGR
jgi:antitoxin ParD1/3/4